MKISFLSLILLIANCCWCSILKAQDRNVIKNVKQYASLKAANNDTLNFLELNYSGAYHMKLVKQFFADLEADGLAVRSYFFSDYPGVITLVCFLEPVDRIKEICKKGKPAYWIQILLAYDLRPDTRFEECRIVYDKMIKFGINRLYSFSDELMGLIKEIKVDFANIYYDNIDCWKKEIGVNDIVVSPTH